MTETDLPERVRDPVCGMDINPRLAKATSLYKGETSHFCSLGCKTKFDQKPELYVKKK